jgi:Holliday junction resolvase
MARYHAGRQLEWEVRKLFESAGWSVIRGAGSKGEVFGMKADLVATKDCQLTKTAVMVVIQCKRKER